MTSQHLADRLLAAHQFARKANLNNEEYERALVADGQEIGAGYTYRFAREAA